MADTDARIQDLTPADSIQAEDRFVLEQAGQAKSLTGQTLLRDLATALAGHGGISNITYTDPVAPSIDGTLTITTADGTDYPFTVQNGNGIASIAVAYGISSSSSPSSVSSWSSSPITPTDARPYAFTRFTLTDDTGASTVAYTITSKAINPTISVGDVRAVTGSAANVNITNSGSSYSPIFDFDFTLPQGEQGETGDYIEPVVYYGQTNSPTTQPTSWTPYPSALDYTVAGDYIWQKTEYTLHDAGTLQSTEVKIIGYIGQNGSGSGTVTDILFNGTTYSPPVGSGTITMNIAASDVGAIKDPTSKSQNQVLTYDGTKWVAANPSTGNVNTVNNVGVTAGTTNISITATNIPTSDNSNVQAHLTSVETDISDIQSALANKVLYLTSVSISATTGNIATISNSAITANHVVAELVFADPSYITTDVSWTTSAGGLVLNGTCSATTTANIVLVKKDN